MLILRFALLLLLASPTTGFSQSDRKARTNQGDQDTTQAGSNLIHVFAVVTDSKGEPVGGLTKEDFLLMEDGVQQPLGFFSMEKIEAGPGSLPALQRETAPGIPQGISGQAASRSLVLLVDTAHITSNAIENVRMALKRFIAENVTDRDLVAIMTSAGKPGVKGEFSADRRKLEAEIMKIRPGFTQFESFLTPALCGKVVRRQPSAVTLAMEIIESEDRATGSIVIPGAPNPQAEAAGKCMMLLLEMASRRRGAMASVGTAIDRLSAMPGQRIIALFSEGFSMIAPGGDIAISDVRPAASSAVRAGVMIYAFDARISTASKQVNIVSLNLSSEIQDSVRDLQHGMALLANQTGGEAFFNSDGLSGQMQQMLGNNRVYYRLAYRPPLDKDRMKYRNISVLVKDHPDYRVRTQKGFVQRDLRRSK